MFGNLGLHVIKFPSGRFGYVGSVPSVLGTEIPATADAVMGCRSHFSTSGELVEWKFPVFESREAAVAFAASKGCEVLS